MREMPFVAVFQPDPGEIGADAPGAKQMRRVERILAGLAHRPPTPRLTRHRPNILRVAVPAALAQIDFATVLLLRRIVRRLGIHPFKLTEVGAYHRGYLVRDGGWLEEGKQPLGENGVKETADAGNQRDKSQVHHSAAPSASMGPGRPFGTDLLAS